MYSAPSDAVFLQVATTVKNSARVPAVALSPSTRLHDDLALGRLGRLKLAIGLEEAFDVEIENDTVAGFEDLGDIVAWLVRHTA